MSPEIQRALELAYKIGQEERAMRRELKEALRSRDVNRVYDCARRLMGIEEDGEEEGARAPAREQRSASRS